MIRSVDKFPDVETPRFQPREDSRAGARGHLERVDPHEKRARTAVQETRLHVLEVHVRNPPRRLLNRIAVNSGSASGPSKVPNATDLDAHCWSVGPLRCDRCEMPAEVGRLLRHRLTTSISD